MTARPAIKAICKQDHIPFDIRPEVHPQEAIGV
jgi:hypothetical protein